jgi:hypothetical protein
VHSRFSASGLDHTWNKVIITSLRKIPTLYTPMGNAVFNAREDIKARLPSSFGNSKCIIPETWFVVRFVFSVIILLPR